MGFLFVTKLQAGGLQLYQKCIPQQIFFKIFDQICCYISKFRDILGTFSSQENFLVVSANHCKVFKTLIPTNIIYSWPDIRVWENLRRLTSRRGVQLYCNGKRYLIFQIVIYSKICSLLFMQLRHIQNPFTQIRAQFFCGKD